MLEAFTAGLLLITFSDLGDQTFFIGFVLAKRHSRQLVFAGVLAALVLMTVLSVLVGQALSLLPKDYIHYGEVTLFFSFGLKLLYDASHMAPDTSDVEVQKATAMVEEAEIEFPKQPTQLTIFLEAFLLTFLAEWGDRTQIATIVLAASNDPLGIILGAMLGHGICSAIAMIKGRWVAEKISERTIAIIGGSLFIILGAIALWKAQ